MIVRTSSIGFSRSVVLSRIKLISVWPRSDVRRVGPGHAGGRPAVFAVCGWLGELVATCACCPTNKQAIGLILAYCGREFVGSLLVSVTLNVAVQLATMFRILPISGHACMLVAFLPS